MIRVWCVEISINGSTWNEIAAFENEQEARTFAQQHLFNLKRINKNAKIRVRAELRLEY